MTYDEVAKELGRLGISGLMLRSFTDHVNSIVHQTVEDCLDDPLPRRITRIMVPAVYGLAELWDDGKIPEEERTSFDINAHTWRDLGRAALLFDHVPNSYDIFPSSIIVEDNQALVICDT